MENVICSENYRQFAYSNDALCHGRIRGIVLSFFGLGYQEMYDADTDWGRRLAAQNIALVIPYSDPWAWMAPRTVQFADRLVEVLLARNGLPLSTPVISTGGSMGGLGALLYCRAAAHTPAACVANCPVCDLPYHYTERPDVPRTLYSAFFDADAPGTLDDALKAASPLHLARAGAMPDLPYTLFLCGADKAVDPAHHGRPFAAELQKQGRRVTVWEVPGQAHCQLTPQAQQQFEQAVETAVAHSAAGKY
jgi:pimeloyl-ACP methyl ester carboxylesterase